MLGGWGEVTQHGLQTGCDPEMCVIPAGYYFNVLLASFGHSHTVVVYQFDLVGVCGQRQLVQQMRRWCKVQ